MKITIEAAPNESFQAIATQALTLLMAQGHEVALEVDPSLKERPEVKQLEFTTKRPAAKNGSKSTLRILPSAS